MRTRQNLGVVSDAVRPRGRPRTLLGGLGLILLERRHVRGCLRRLHWVSPLVSDPLEIFEAQRPALFALAYRMLGEISRAEDIVQDAWLRWREHSGAVARPRSFLLTMVARLCLDELGSARRRRELQRSDRLPEPVAPERTPLARLESLDQLSIAFLVLLQRLTPAERAVFLLHEVFDTEHAEIAQRLGKTEAACRQLLKRAKQHVALERRALETPKPEHQHLFEAFVSAIAAGDESALEQLLAADAVLVVDPGAATRYGRMRALGRPVVGARRVLAVIQGFLTQQPTARTRFLTRMLNAEPGLLTVVDGRVTSATMISVADGKIRHLFVQYDADKLRHLSIDA